MFLSLALPAIQTHSTQLISQNKTHNINDKHIAFESSSEPDKNAAIETHHDPHPSVLEPNPNA